jgi:hypothetical protein
LDAALGKTFYDTYLSLSALILLGEPNLTHCQDPISWDKLLELPVAPVNRILSLALDLHCLAVRAPPEFIAAIVDLLRTTWGPRHCSFHAREAKELTGMLNHIAFGAQRLTFLLGNIYSLLAAALWLNHTHLIRSSRSFCNALHAIFTVPETEAGKAICSFHTSNTACTMHGYALHHHISGDLKRNLRLVECILTTTDNPT